MLWRYKKCLPKEKVHTNSSSTHRHKRWYHELYHRNNKISKEYKSIEDIKFMYNNFFSNLENNLELLQFTEDLQKEYNKFKTFIQCIHYSIMLKYLVALS